MDLHQCKLSQAPYMAWHYSLCTVPCNIHLAKHNGHRGCLGSLSFSFISSFHPFSAFLPASPVLCVRVGRLQSQSSGGWRGNGSWEIYTSREFVSISHRNIRHIWVYKLFKFNHLGPVQLHTISWEWSNGHRILLYPPPPTSTPVGLFPHPFPALPWHPQQSQHCNPKWKLIGTSLAPHSKSTVVRLSAEQK